MYNGSIPAASNNSAPDQNTTLENINDKNGTRPGNKTTDYDVAGGEDDETDDGGDDYVIAPGVDIPIPVRLGTGYG